jgi:hypothetical protein
MATLGGIAAANVRLELRRAFEHDFLSLDGGRAGRLLPSSDSDSWLGGSGPDPRSVAGVTVADDCGRSCPGRDTVLTIEDVFLDGKPEATSNEWNAQLRDGIILG